MMAEVMTLVYYSMRDHQCGFLGHLNGAEPLIILPVSPKPSLPQLSQGVYEAARERTKTQIIKQTGTEMK